MALGPRLDLRQSQSLVMTPQLQQAIRLLTASNLELESYVSDALDANPLLEAGSISQEDGGADSGGGDAGEPEASDSATAAEPGASDPGGDAPLDLDPAALDRDRDTGDASTSRTGAAAGDAEWGAAAGGERPAGSDDYPDVADRAGGTTLVDHLDAQIGALATSTGEAFAARHIAGLLDDAGYLSTSLEEIASDLGLTPDAAEDALTVVQMCDPTGIGARDLAECLALQAREADRYDPCMRALIDNLESLARGDVAKLRRICSVDEDDFVDMVAELRSYDPRPGLAFAAPEADPVVPDVLLTANAGGGWDIALNEATLPRLVVNREYYLSLHDGASDDGTRGWLKERLADAHWLLRALDQRQKTIVRTAGEIVKRQDGFFRLGVAELRPLTLREVGEAIDMHESTVSRVTSGKYLSCDRGCFELKYFFSSGVASSDGEGASAEAIKARIRTLIEGEDNAKVLSDQKLADLLGDEGFELARRTVAKYREAIGIGSSAQRRRLKRLDRV